MSLKYEPCWESLHIFAKQLFLDSEVYRSVQLDEVFLTKIVYKVDFQESIDAQIRRLILDNC